MGNNITWFLANTGNCLLESVSLGLLWQLFEPHKFTRYEWLRYTCVFAAVSLVITFMDFVGFVMLPINFLIVLISFWAACYRTRWRTIFLNTLFAFFSLSDMQSIMLCLLPESMRTTHSGFFLSNGVALTCCVALTLFSRKYRWDEFYLQNAKAVWVCIVAVCVPGLVTAQITAVWMHDMPRSTLIILSLLQVLYLSMAALLLMLSSQKNEHRQLAATKKYVDELNAHLEDSRRHVHDFNKHLRYLRNTVVTGSADAALTAQVDAYCDKLLTLYDEEEVLLQLDSPLFRALLYGRRTQAQREHIQFQLHASTLLPEFPVQSYQLVEIFDNLMDNAFESVRDLPEEQRWIRVTLSAAVQEGRQSHVLCIENPYETINLSDIVSDRPYTSKKGHQGVGLQRVSRLVSDTGGRLILRAPNAAQEKVFTAKVQYDVIRE